MRNFDELFPTFTNYTENMYLGNEPAGKGHERLDGGFCDRWQTKYGTGETYDGRIIHARFSLNAKVTIYIIGNALWVVDFRHSGKPDFWEHCVNHAGMPGSPCTCESSRHKLEPERLEKYLHTVIPNCKFWDMVQKRALELCRMGGDS